MAAEIKGLKELSAALKKVPKDVRGKALDKAVGTAARSVRDRAKTTYAPILTGRLRRSITASKDRAASTVENSVYNVGYRKKIAWYGGLVEEGTSKMGAQPFLRPALDTELENAVTIMARVLTKALKLR